LLRLYWRRRTHRIEHRNLLLLRKNLIAYANEAYAQNCKYCYAHFHASIPPCFKLSKAHKQIRLKEARDFNKSADL
jgi:hypothetical protein